MSDAVDPTTLHRLLELQNEDGAIRQLERRRDELPETQRLATLRGSLDELTADIEIARKQLHELTQEQTRIEGEMGLLDQKIAREESRLYSGGVSNPRELGALQSEVAMLKSRRGEMEDGLLEVMVQRDQASSTLSSLEEEHERLSAETSELSEKVKAMTGDIETELAAHTEARERVAVEIPDDLRTLYEQVRDQKGGVGAAALRGGTCEGCHTQLPSREVERLRSAGGLQRCDNCRRILVVV